MYVRKKELVPSGWLRVGVKAGIHGLVMVTCCTRASGDKGRTSSDEFGRKL